MGNVLAAIPPTPPPIIRRVPLQWLVPGEFRRIPDTPGRTIEIVHDPSYEIMHTPTDTLTEQQWNSQIGVEVTHREKCERYEDLVQLYNNTLHHYSVAFPTDYHNMLGSSGTSTDSHVAFMLKKLNMYGPMFEADVLLMTQCIWASAMQYPDMQTTLPEKDRWTLDIKNVLSVLSNKRNEKNDEDDQIEYEYPEYDLDMTLDETSFSAKCALIQCARRYAQEKDNRPKTYTGKFDAIYRTKMAYIGRVTEDRKKAGIDGSRAVCSVLTCWNTVSNQSFIMNSMLYCDDHHGVAIFNGLRHYNHRHFCHACGLWNVLGLKYTCEDWGHIQYHVLSMQVPFMDELSSTHNRKNVKITWFKNPRITFNHRKENFMSDYEHGCGLTPHKLVKMEGMNTQYKYINKRGRSLRVPYGAVAFVNEDEIVDAWIRVMGMDLWTNEPVPVMKSEYIDRIFETIPNGNPLLRIVPDPDNVIRWSGEENPFDGYTYVPPTPVAIDDEDWDYYDEDWDYHDGTNDEDWDHHDDIHTENATYEP